MFRKNMLSTETQLHHYRDSSNKIFSKDYKQPLFLQGKTFTQPKQTYYLKSQQPLWVRSTKRKYNEMSHFKQTFKSQFSNSMIVLNLQNHQAKHPTKKKQLPNLPSRQEQPKHPINTKIKLQRIKQKFPIVIITQSQKNNTNNILVKRNKPMIYLQQKELSKISAQSFIIRQYPSKRTILGNGFRKNGEIASLTKIMTFLCIYKLSQEFQKNLDDQKIHIDQFAPEMTGTSAELYEGDCFSVKELLYGMMLPSGNDAATALAIWGNKLLANNKDTSVKHFVNYMNKVAKEIGMNTSNFANPHGLSNNAASSNPQEVAMMIEQCLNISLFRQVVSCRVFKCVTENNGVKREVVWQNTNKLLRRNGFIGVKTGVTITAGPCLASCYQINNRILISVLLRTTKLSRRFKQTRWILGMALSKIDSKLYKQQIESILREDKELDSDNSEDEQQFSYERKDAFEMAKRIKILKYEM